MASMFSKDKRIIWVRRIRQFWFEYRSKKIGMIGLALLTTYVLVAFLAPYLTPYDPISQPRLAQAFAMPEWVTIFPQYQDLAKTQRETLSWNVEEGSQFVKGWGDTVGLQYESEQMQTATIVLSSGFLRMESPPNEFFISFTFGVETLVDTQYSLSLTIFTPEGDSYLLWRLPATSIVKSQDVTIDSKDPIFIDLIGFELQENVANIIFSQKGDYVFNLETQFRPLTENGEIRLNLEDSETVLLGHVHGVLGTDYLAKDIFAQIVYGARLSLAVGLLAAVVGTSIGILVGVVSGYIGGAVDEVSMRIVDVLLCLPLLPLLLALVHLYGRNVYYIVLFIAIFGWQGLARVIRSQTLSIRETAYIETARASGASGFYIMLRHIVPNIIPVAFASMVLAVPSAILFEAALSFLGFGDPRVPTWGMMLQHAFGFGGFVNLSWWWILPPGLAIIGICLAFVFIGYAFDEIVNPRLRRRR
ncbi:MAG: ABC transporter permease [Candidatus Bathyarchaeota archaeon]|jgi:peptide/nickel transport system permease protein